ncbi:MAG TPA: class I SAM-dependent methyltransferase [Aggregatilineales bacterium]|nr:class I SAM-dependent methyltransferase [Anaerolineales bacterium]HRE49004.1 class I SAM-dependent methyltransferase [Aggregatilineales bacterium]
MPDTTFTVEPYAALSSVYQAGGFAEYSLQIAPKLIDLAFDLEWTGKTLLDIACGTGDLACWFAGRGLRVRGIDLSAPMVRRAQAGAETGGYSADFDQGDMRTFTTTTPYEMVTCIGSSLNYAPSLKELERIFRAAHAALMPGKLFLFDLRTILGLVRAGEGDRIVSDDPARHLILSRNGFNHETLTLTTRYTIFTMGGSGWVRAEETHTLRGYPVQGVIRLAESCGFKTVRIVTPEYERLEAYDAHPDAEQVIVVAVRGE